MLEGAAVQAERYTQVKKNVDMKEKNGKRE